MLLFNAILFKLFKGNPVNCANQMVYFRDLEIFGINNFLKIGEEVFAKKVGEMWPPKTFFLVIQHILAKNRNSLPSVMQGKEKKLTVLIMDSNFVASQIESKLQQDLNILLVINLSIGMQAPEDKYRQFLFDVCHIPQFCGIVGGQSNMSYFIVGHNGTLFYYLDPHQIKSQEGQDNMNSYTVTGFYEIPYSSLLPYITLTFMVNRDNFSAFTEMLEKANEKSQPLGMFETSEVFKSIDTMGEAEDLINIELLKSQDGELQKHPVTQVRKPIVVDFNVEQRERIPSFDEIVKSPQSPDESITSFNQVTFDEKMESPLCQNVQLLDEIEGFHELTVLDESPRAQSNLNKKIQSIPTSMAKKEHVNFQMPFKKLEKASSFCNIPKSNFKKH